MMKKKALVASVLLSVCSINMGVQAAFHSKIDINTDKDITYKTSNFSGTSTSPEVGEITAPSFTDTNDTGATINILVIIIKTSILYLTEATTKHQA